MATTINVGLLQAGTWQQYKKLITAMVRGMTGEVSRWRDVMVVMSFVVSLAVGIMQIIKVI